MKYYALIVSTLLIFFTACSDPNPEQQSATSEHSQPDAHPMQAKGDAVYGGTLNLAISEHLESIFPHKAADLISANLCLQQFEGLVKFDSRTLNVRPSLAENWSVSDDGLVYTFNIKKGVHFRDDECFDGGKGREVTAQDFAYSFQLLCTPSPNNIQFPITLEGRLKGASEYFAAAEAGKPLEKVAGIAVVDKHTIQLTLEQPSNSFIYILAQAALTVMPKEAVEKYGNKLTVGTGPFFLAPNQSIDGNQLILLANPHYYRLDEAGNQLPFLDSVVFHFMPAVADQLQDFELGKLDVVADLPPDLVLKLVQENIAAFNESNPLWVLDPTPEMSTDYYQFNMTRPELQDKRVRQAINYAINRASIIEYILNGEAYAPGNHGITPPSFSNYDISDIPGYDFNLEKARKLMAQAGYPNGKGFPQLTLELNSGGYRNSKVAIEIQNSLLNNLGIKVDLEVNPMALKMENDRFARSDISRKAWIADFPGPESFLNLYYGKTVPQTLDQPSYPNTARYQNNAFDELFEQAVAEPKIEKSYALFKQAEKILMNDPPLIVLWYNETQKVKSASVQNLPSNSMDYWDFGNVYLKPLAGAAAATQASDTAAAN